ncbi:MAG: flavodoxin family protein [Candidatus Woesearchaeota archaeon]
MKYLIIYYTRTNTTKKLAEYLAKNLDCEIEELIDFKNRDGGVGFISSGKDAVFKKQTKIKKLSKDLSKYNHIIIGTPVWVGNITPAIRTFLLENKDKIKSCSFFCTLKGNDIAKTFIEMESLLDKKPVSTLTITTKEIANNNYKKKADSFCLNLKNID